MSRFDRLSRLDVEEPCHADWNTMKGDESRRFCSGCRKHVHNLSEMSADEAEALLNSGPVCVRFRRDDRGRLITKTALIGGLAILAAGCASPALESGEELTGKVSVPQHDVTGTPLTDIKDDKKPEPEITMGAIAMPTEVMGEISAPDSKGDATAKRKSGP